jgi:hypothetical protein
MSGRTQPRIIRQTRVLLYEDKVIRKTARFHSVEELTLSTAKVTTTLANGEDSVFVELSGHKERPSKPDTDTIIKFQMNLSGSYWDYRIDQRGLRLTVSTADPSGRLKEKQVFKMSSREKLTAWAAEIIQASTLRPEHILQHCFHVTIPTCKDGTVETSDDQLDVLLQVRHPNDTQLVARDPLSLEDLRCWDISELEMFSFEFKPELRLLLKSRESGKGDYIYFLSSEIAHHALTFVESFLELKLPKLFDSVKRKVLQRASLQGPVIHAILYRLNFGSSIEERDSVAAISDKPSKGTCHGYSSALPYAVTNLLKSCGPGVAELLSSSPTALRDQKSEDEEEEDEQSESSGDEENCICVKSGSEVDSYVEMAPNALGHKLTEQFNDDSKSKGNVYVNTGKHVLWAEDEERVRRAKHFAMVKKSTNYTVDDETEQDGATVN